MLLTQSDISIQYRLRFGVCKLFWWSSTFLISYIKIILSEPLKRIFCMLLLIEHDHHMPRQVFDATLQQFFSNENKKLMLSLSDTKFDIFNTMKKYDFVCYIFHRCHSKQTKKNKRSFTINVPYRHICILMLHFISVYRIHIISSKHGQKNNTCCAVCFRSENKHQRDLRLCKLV